MYRWNVSSCLKQKEIFDIPTVPPPRWHPTFPGQTWPGWCAGCSGEGASRPGTRTHPESATPSLALQEIWGGRKSCHKDALTKRAAAQGSGYKYWSCWWQRRWGVTEAKQMRRILHQTAAELLVTESRAAKCDFGEILFSPLTGSRPPETWSEPGRGRYQVSCIAQTQTRTRTCTSSLIKKTFSANVMCDRKRKKEWSEKVSVRIWEEETKRVTHMNTIDGLIGVQKQTRRSSDKLIILAGGIIASFRLRCCSISVCWHTCVTVPRLQSLTLCAAAIS